VAQVAHRLPVAVHTIETMTPLASLELLSSLDSGFIAMIFGSKRSGAHRESYLGQKRLEETEARAGDGPS
jgi:hypothetical protein